MSETVLRTRCHPEANGRAPLSGETAWTATLPLEDGTSVVIRMGKEGRDLLFGMLIADCHDSDEPEPDTCHECGELAVGYSEGTPYCGAHYRSRPRPDR